MPAAELFVPLRRVALTFVLTAASTLAACAGNNAYYDPTKPHHRPDGFQNNHLNFEPRGLGDLLKWRWEALRDGLPKPPQQATPQVAPDLAFLRANATAGSAMQPAVTWIGHATVLAQFGGLNVLTDPIFSERASPVSVVGPKRAQPPGIAPAQLPRIDVVLISHNHYDHLDEASVRLLDAQPGGPPLFLVPLGLKPWLEAVGARRAVELDWWQSHRVGEVEFVSTPVQHWSARSFTDRLQTLWSGWAAFAPDLHLYFAGDTGYSPDFAQTRERFAARQGAAQGGGFDIALIPIGAYEPRWFMKEQHVGPDESVRVHRDLGAKRSLGIHWGTFELTDEALDEPPIALRQALQAQGVSGDNFWVFAIGETRRLPPRPR